jgi:hypothetical protein
MLTENQEGIVKNLVDSLEAHNTPVLSGLFSDIVNECSNRQKALNEIKVINSAFRESMKLMMYSDCETLRGELGILEFTCNVINNRYVQIKDSRGYTIANLYYELDSKPNEYYDSYCVGFYISYNPNGNTSYKCKNLKEVIPHLKPVLKRIYENLNLKN